MKMRITLFILVAAIAVLFTTVSCKQDKGFSVGVVTGTTFEEKARSFSKVNDVKLYKDDILTLTELATGRNQGNNPEPFPHLFAPSSFE
jgi:ABC-type amino acid transport substrate-binding protein